MPFIKPTSEVTNLANDVQKINPRINTAHIRDYKAIIVNVPYIKDNLQYSMPVPVILFTTTNQQEIRWFFRNQRDQYAELNKIDSILTN